MGELYFTAPNASGIFFRKVNAPAESNDDLGPLTVFSGTDPYFRSNIMVQETGRIWVFTRRGDQPEQNVRYRYSDNGGQDWTPGVAFATNSTRIRIGSMPYVNGNPALVTLHLDTARGYEYHLWNGTNFEARADHSIAPGAFGGVRVFTHNVVRGNAMHLIYGYGPNLHHYWKYDNNGEGAWNHQMIEASLYAEDFDWDPISTVRGDDLYLFYCDKLTADSSSSTIFYKKWNQISQTWTGPQRISTDPSHTFNTYPNTTFQVPEGSNYIPVFWQSGSDTSNQQILFSKIVIGN